jgi:hypothetical protein
LNGANVRSVTWKLNEAPQAEFDFQNYDPTLKSALLLQRDIFVRFNNTINVETGLPEVFLGTLGRRRGKPGTHTIIADGYEQWLKERCVEVGSLQYDNVDQFDIAWGLIQTAQTGTNYDLGITTAYAPSGKLRYRIYPRDRHQYILDLLREFNKIDQGLIKSSRPIRSRAIGSGFRTIRRKDRSSRWPTSCGGATSSTTTTTKWLGHEDQDDPEGGELRRHQL